MATSSLPRDSWWPCSLPQTTVVTMTMQEGWWLWMRNSCVHSRYSSTDGIGAGCHTSVVVEQALCSMLCNGNWDCMDWATVYNSCCCVCSQLYVNCTIVGTPNEVPCLDAAYVCPTVGDYPYLCEFPFPLLYCVASSVRRFWSRPRRRPSINTPEWTPGGRQLECPK